MKTCLRKIGIRAAAILFAASVSLALLFTACSNNAGGNTGGGTPAAVSYRIIFSVDGGHGTLKAKAEGVTETATSPISVEKDKTVTFIAAPESSYKVNKWTITGGTFEAGTGTNGSLTAKVKITAATTVNVSFTELPPGSYTVKHYQEGTDGSYPAEPTGTESLSGTSGKPVAYTPKTGGAYTGFTYKPALTKVNGIVQENGTIAADNSTVVELYYERNTVNVTFKLAGGNIGGNTNDVVKSGKYGAPLTAPTPVQTGFVFKGWNPALPSPLVFPAADTQYTADWAPLYTVTFGTPANGTLKATAEGAAETPASPISVEQDKTVTFTAVPAAGYKVETWTITPASALQEGGTSGSSTAKVKITAATTVNVSFTKEGYVVTFDAKGGTPVPAAQTVKYKEKASVPSEPVKEGYTFKGWHNKAGNAPWNFTVNEVTGNTELYAKWQINTYPVTFNVEGAPPNGTLKAELAGTVIVSGKPVEYGKTVTFTAGPASGYKVDTWTITPASALQEGGTAGSSTAKVTITAVTTVKVTFKLADKTYTVKGVSFTMKGIAAVTNGTVGHADNAEDNAPHTVSLSAYLIGKTEVTQELWKAVMGNNPSWFQGSANPSANGEEQGKWPVERVTWYECIAFCNALTAKVYDSYTECVYYTEDGDPYHIVDAEAKKIPVMNMSKKGFRLPTEAEWEWAAMGGTSDKWAGTDIDYQLENYAWYIDNSNNRTHKVDQNLRNDYGLCDMSGNVWEWCWDWYQYDCLSGTLPPDYAGPASSSLGRRVKRGGSYRSDHDRVTRAFRQDESPVLSSRDSGLRLVCRP